MGMRRGHGGPWLVAAMVVLAGCGTPEERWTQQLERAESALQKGRVEKAQRYYDAAVETSRGFGETDSRYKSTLERRVDFALVRSDIDKAEAVFQETIAVAKRISAAPPEALEADDSGYHEDWVATLLYKRAFMYAQRLPPQDALPYAQEALDAAIAAYGEPSSSLRPAFALMSDLYHNMGDYETSLATLERAATQPGVTVENVTTGSSQLDDFARNYAALGDFKKAQAFLERNENIVQGRGTRQISLTTRGMALHAHVLMAQGDFARAGRSLSRATNTLENNRMRRTSKSLAYVERITGQYYEVLGDFRAAETHFNESLRLGRRFGAAYPDEHLRTMLDLAHLRIRMAETDKAEALLERARADAAAFFLPDHDLLGRLDLEEAELHAAQGDWARAVALTESALQLFEAKLAPGHPNIAACYEVLGRAAHAQGDLTEAGTQFDKALAIRLVVHGGAHPESVACRASRALIAVEAGDLDTARALIDATTEAVKDVRETHASQARLQHARAALLEAEGDVAGAEAALKSAQQIWDDTVGPYHPDAASTGQAYARLLRAAGRVKEAEQMSNRVALMQSVQ